MEATERIAHFVAAFPGDRIAPEALRAAAASVLDYTGVLIAGLDEEVARLVRRTVSAMGVARQASVWGSDLLAPVSLAALANGTAAHALDLDDTNPAMMSHPSIQLLPGLFALGERRHASGADILDAYVVGFEVGARLGRALYPTLITGGWFPVGVLGTVMQASACARLLRLEPERVRMAIGVAGNLASGLRCNNGTMAKPLLAGQVGANGVLAATLARDWMTASPSALEDRFGFAANFGGVGPERLTQELEGLGEELAILTSGTSYKLHACCAGGHIPIDCALTVASQSGFDPSQIEEVEVSIHHGVRYLLIHPRPATPAEARFSLEYAVARALLDRHMGPEQFTAAKVADPAVRSLMDRVSPAYFGEGAVEPADAAGPFPVELRVRMRDGGVRSARAEHARGTPANPIGRADLEEKFRSCTTGRLSAVNAGALLSLLKDLDRVRDVTELAAYLSPRASYHHGMEVRP